MAGVHTYKDGVVGRLYKGLQGLVKASRITDRRGRGPAGLARRTVEVGDTALRRARTSCWPPARRRESLPGLEIDGERVITSEHALHARPRARRRSIVLGGGVIGVEFASVWRSFGAEVTIVEALPHLVPLEDEASSKLLERAFRRRGIDFELGARFDERQAHRHRRRRDASRAARRSRPSCCWSPSAAARSRPASATRRPASRSSAASSRRRVLPDQRPDVSAVGDLIADPAARPRRLRRGHPGRRAPRRPDPAPDRLRRRPAHHLLRARGRLGRPHRGAGRESTAPTRRRSPTTWPATAAAPDPEDRGRGQGRRGQTDGPVARRPHRRRPGRRAHRRGPADLQLGGAADRGRPADPPAPDPVRGDRRGAPGARRQAPARPRLTPRPPDASQPEESLRPCRSPSPCPASARASPRAPSPAG